MFVDLFKEQLGLLGIWTDRQDDSYILPQLCLLGV